MHGINSTLMKAFFSGGITFTTRSRENTDFYICITDVNGEQCNSRIACEAEN